MERPSNLLDLMRELRDRDERDKTEGALTRDDWIGELNHLMVTVRGWLRPAVSEGLTRVEAHTVHISDGPYGEYDAPALKVDLPGDRTIWLRPAGLLAVGARGWVDVVSGANRAMLVLNRRGTWKVRTPSGVPGTPGKLDVLDERRFAQMLSDLVV
jgi:hypothetical protein